MLKWPAPGRQMTNPIVTAQRGIMHTEMISVEEPAVKAEREYMTILYDSASAGPDTILRQAMA